jgi:gas vesicle GvpC-like protein
MSKATAERLSRLAAKRSAKGEQRAPERSDESGKR